MEQMERRRRHTDRRVDNGALWLALILLAVMFFVAAVTAPLVWGAEETRTLGRAQLGDPLEGGLDSYISDFTVKGDVTVTMNEESVITSMKFTAKSRDNDLHEDNDWVMIDHHHRGAWYDFFDWDTNELIRTHWERRAPCGTFDPAMIFKYKRPDGDTVELDYRCEQGDENG